MQGRSAVQVLDILLAVELELVDHRQAVILGVVEVGTVHVVLGRDEIAVLLVPLVVLAGEVLAGDELGVEHAVGRTVLAVGDVDGLEQHVDELAVVLVGIDLQAEELGGVGQAVDADREVLLAHVDEAGAVDVQHVGLQEVLDDLVERGLVLVDAHGMLGDGFPDVLVEFLLVVGLALQGGTLRHHEALLLLEVLARGILDKAVQVDRHHGLGAGRHGGRTHRILVRRVVVAVVQVLQGIAKAAAAGQTVRAVGDVAEEAVALRPHLGGEVGVLLVGIIVAAVGQQRHRLDREGQDVVVALLVEPIHEVLLQPGEGLPLRRRPVRKTEVAEHALEIGLVKVADVPEHGLVAAVAGRHVHRMHDLLETIVDDLAERAFLDIVLHDLVQAVQVVVAVILADEIVQVHQELRRRDGTHELRGDRIHQVDELAAEGLEVGRGDGHAAQLAQAAHEERIHRDGDAVGIARGTALIVLVQDVGLQVVDVLLGHAAAIEGADLVLHDVAVLLDVVLLVELVAEGHDVLARDVGVGVELGAGRGVGGLDVVADEVVLLAEVHAPVVGLDVLKGDLLVDGHQGLHDLAADLLAGDLVIDIKVVDNRHHHVLGTGLAGSDVSQADAVHQFDLVVFFIGAVGFADFHSVRL